MNISTNVEICFLNLVKNHIPKQQNIQQEQSGCHSTRATFNFVLISFEELIHF